MKRGEIWWASLAEPVGSAPGYRRPVLIIQSDAFTASAVQTVVIAAITSNLRLQNAPGNVFISPGQSDLPRESVVNVSQVLTVNKAALTEQAGSLPARLMQQVDEGLRLAFGL